MTLRFGRRKFLVLSIISSFSLFTIGNFLITMRSLTIVNNSINDKNFIDYNKEDWSNFEANDENLVSIVKKSYLVPPSKLPYNLSTDENYQSRSTSYHWDVINQLVVKFFTDEPPGFFVEAGALDGEFLTNTLWLEEDKGWTGLLVEPEPKNYAELVNKRRKSWITNSCLSDTTHSKVMGMIATEKKEEEPLDPMAIRGGAHFIGAHADDKSYERFTEEKLITSEFTAQCFPLYTFLLALNVKKIDFLSLDLQGPEIPIFKTLPLDQIYVRSVVIEHESFSEGIDMEFLKMMDEKGFTIAAVGGSPDYFFINKSDKKLTSRLKYLLDNDAIERPKTSTLVKKQRTSLS